MEGGAISVSSTVTLPAQPSSGVLDRIPLGGDGYSAPSAAYSVAAMTVTGDASSGNAGLDITMDNRFCSLISFVTSNVAQGTSADADFRFTIASSDGRYPLMADAGTQAAVASLVSSQEVTRTWHPPPVILPGGGQVGRIQVRWLNVDGDVYSVHAMIYLFRIDVREHTPMGPLLWARGST